MMLQKSSFSKPKGGQAPRSDGTKFAKRQNFYIVRKICIYFFILELSLIVCSFFLRLHFFSVFLLHVFGSLAMHRTILLTFASD